MIEYVATLNTTFTKKVEGEINHLFWQNMLVAKYQIKDTQLFLKTFEIATYSLRKLEDYIIFVITEMEKVKIDFVGFLNIEEKEE